jgi:1-acyl-sn-glycerol-3-phosphate acyltransferase
VKFLRAVPFWIVAFLASFFTCLFATPFMLCGGSNIAHGIARMWGRVMLAASAARLVVVHGERFVPGEARILVANHSSYLDIPALFAAFPGQARFIARKSLDWMPFIGWFIRLGGHFSIDRDDPRQALRLMERITERMKSHHLSPILFPEGTRSRDGRLAALKPGALQFAVSAGVPVQPIAIIGSAPILPKGAWGPHRSGTIEVRVGPPIPTADLRGSAGRKQLTEQVRAALLALGAPDGA